MLVNFDASEADTLRTLLTQSLTPLAKAQRIVPIVKSLKIFRGVGFRVKLHFVQVDTDATFKVSDVRKIREALAKAASAMEKASGAEVRIAGAINFDEDTVAITLEIAASKARRDAHLKAAARAAKAAGMPNVIGKSFEWGGKRYAIIEIVPSRPKFPVRAERDGKVYKFPASVFDRVK